MMVTPLSDAATLRPVVIEAAMDQTVTAGQDETVDILFSDGTSVILSPGASLTIVEYAFDPATGTGKLVLRLDAGRARISGGRLNDEEAILVETPEATLSLFAGSAMIVVANGETRAYLLNGLRLTVASGGEVQSIFKPEFGVVADASGVSAPERVDPALAAADLDAFSQDGDLVLAATEQEEEATLSSEGTASSGTTGSSGAGSASEAEAEDTPASSPFPEERPDLADLNTDSAPSPPTTVSFSAGLGLLPGAGAYEPTIGMGPANVAENNSSTVNSNHPVRWQEFRIDQTNEIFPPDEEGVPEVPRNFGPTTNKIFQSATLTEPLTNGAPSSFGVAQGGLSYGDGAGAFGIKVAAPKNLTDQDALFLLGHPSAGRFSTNSLVVYEEGFDPPIEDAATTLGDDIGVFVDGLNAGTIGGGPRALGNFSTSR